MKLLVIGCGSIGQRHAANAAALSRVGVFDADVPLAKRCAEGVGARLFETVADALAWKPNAAVIATPHRSHLDLARTAIDAGADVLIEKPLSHAYEGVPEFIGHTSRAQRRAYVVCNMRFHPGPATLKRSLNRIGRPLFARAHVGNYLPAMRPGRDYRELYAARRSEGGGVILDAVHEIDYLSWLFGPAASVACSAGHISDLDIDVEDHALLALHHVSDVRVSAELDYLRPRKSRGCEVIGTEGVLSWHSDGKTPERCLVRFSENSESEWQVLADVASVDPAKPYQDMMSAFVQELERPGTTELATVAEAARVLAVALAAKRSAAELGTAQQLVEA